MYVYITSFMVENMLFIHLFRIFCWLYMFLQSIFEKRADNK
jgi:hypothetical protein